MSKSLHQILCDHREGKCISQCMKGKDAFKIPGTDRYPVQPVHLTQWLTSPGSKAALKPHYYVLTCGDVTWNGGAPVFTVLEVYVTQQQPDDRLKKHGRAAQ